MKPSISQIRSFIYLIILVSVIFGAGIVQATFTGHEYDEENALQYYGARYLDNELGRFTSIDPATLTLGNSKKFEDNYNRPLEFHLGNPQNLNGYSYVTNNPLRYTDPDGEIIPLLVIAGIVTAGILFDNIEPAQAPTMDYTNNNQSVVNETKDFAEIVSPAYDNLSGAEQFGVGLLAFGGTKKLTGTVQKKVTRKADQILTEAAEHAFDQKHFAGKTVNQIKEIAKDTYDNFDIKGVIKDVKKYFYNSKTNTLLIDNPKQPTIFQPDRGSDYVRDNILKDLFKN